MKMLTYVCKMLKVVLIDISVIWGSLKKNSKNHIIVILSP